MLQTIAGAILATRGVHELSPSKTGIIPHPSANKKVGLRETGDPPPLQSKATVSGGQFHRAIPVKDETPLQVPGPRGQSTHGLTW